MPIFPMHRHKVARLGQAQHHFQLLLAGVAVNMNRGHAVIQHLGPLPQQVVNSAAHQQFIPRNGRRRNHHRIPLHHRNLPVVLIGNPHQRRSRLPLTAGSQQHHPLRGIRPNFVQGKQRTRRQVQVAHLRRHIHIVRHTPPDNTDLAVMPHRRIHHLLHPGNQRGKSSHHHPPRRIPNGPLKGVAQNMLRRRITRHFRISGIGTEQQHPVGTVLRQGSQVNSAPVHRGMVDLEIPGMYHRPQGGADGNSHRVRDAVADPKPTRLKVSAELIRNIRLNDFQHRAPGCPVFLQLD